MKRKKVKRFLKSRIKDELGKAEIAKNYNMPSDQMKHEYTADTLKDLMENIFNECRGSLKSNSNIIDNPIATNLEELHRKFNEGFRDLKLPSRIKKSDKYDGTLPSLTSMVFEQMKPHLSVHVTPEETTYAFNPNACPIEVMRDISSGLYKDYLNYHQMDISIKPPR